MYLSKYVIVISLVILIISGIWLYLEYERFKTANSFSPEIEIERAKLKRNYDNRLNSVLIIKTDSKRLRKEMCDAAIVYGNNLEKIFKNGSQFHNSVKSNIINNNLFFVNIKFTNEKLNLNYRMDEIEKYINSD